MGLEGPKFDELRLNNTMQIKEEEDAEQMYLELQENGVACDECEDLYFPDELIPQKEEDNTILVCIYCKRD